MDLTDKTKYHVCAMIVSVEERDRIKASAKEHGLNVSEYLRLKTGI